MGSDHDAVTINLENGRKARLYHVNLNIAPKILKSGDLSQPFTLRTDDMRMVAAGQRGNHADQAGRSRLPGKFGSQGPAATSTPSTECKASHSPVEAGLEDPQ